MKTDKWFYELFLSQPGMLAELIPGVDADWQFTYSAVVVKEKAFEFDGVFTPIADDLTIPMVFAEAQMQTDQEQSTEIGKGLLQTAETEAEFERRLSLIETILANKFPDLTTEMIMQLLDLKQMDITQSKFYQEIKREGHQEGRQEGRQDEAAAIVLRQLGRRLGELSEAQVAQIRQLSISQLENLGEALLDFVEMTDLEQFLAQLV